ncbi:MAG: hypothetical protein PHS77_09425 [Gallionellaceae bacterium]|nr:hypothetical protein [Gallionellaceae bacterium]
MNDSVQITIDRDVYRRPQLLMAPPLSDANAVIKSLLLHERHASPAAIEVEASTRHFSFTQELERAQGGSMSAAAPPDAPGGAARNGPGPAPHP